jgi:hypothetical protein
MRKWIWTAVAVLPLAVAGGLIYANSRNQSGQPEEVGAAPYVCPLTGEPLPCPRCCPLNQQK